MSSLLISKLKNNLSDENLKFVLQTNNKSILEDVNKYIFSYRNKDAVSFLIQNNKIPKKMFKELIDFIMKNNFF